MVRRFRCLLCAVVLAAVLSGGAVSASAAPHCNTAAALSTHRVIRSRRPPALVSAMLLVLAGVSVTLLFDKKE